MESDGLAPVAHAMVAHADSPAPKLAQLSPRISMTNEPSVTGHSGVGDFTVVGPAIPPLLAQAPVRSASLDNRSAGPATPISPTLETPSGAMQPLFPALSLPTSPKQTMSPESQEMDTYFDAQSVDQFIREAAQGQNVTAQYAPDVQGFTASVYGDSSRNPSPIPDRLPYLSPESESAPILERLPYLSPDKGTNASH